MRRHHVRELRKIDSTSYGVTLPKKAVLAELEEQEEQEKDGKAHEGAHVGIEVSKTEEGNLIFEIELVSNDSQSELDKFSGE